MSRKNKYLIATIVTVALMIIYTIIFCNGMSNLEPWTDSDYAFIIPIGVLSGLGFFFADGLWSEIKKK